MPFIRTAILGSPGAPVLGTGDSLTHCGMVRIRVTGSGVLRSTLFAMDDQSSIDLPNITMAAGTAHMPTALANFTQTRMSLRIRTTSIDEVFVIQKIIFYMKPVWSMVPG